MTTKLHPNLRPILEGMSQEQIEKILTTEETASDLIDRMEWIKDQLRKPQEVTIEGWVARDEDGALNLFDREPERIAECAWAYFPGHSLGFSLPKESFPSVTWKSEPRKVKLTITPIES